VIRVREYGVSGPLVIVLHGGPGAPGVMAPVARELAGRFRVLEPLQRASGGEPLTVARHVADLLEVIESRCGGERPALVGSSWGAMLALAFGAAHPGAASRLALIGCGTFDRAARARLEATLAERRSQDVPWQGKWWESPGFLRMYGYDLTTTDLEMEAFDARGAGETWSDMVRLQDEGLYPAAFSAIHEPVLMLHGDYDPHPGRMILAGLKPSLPQVEYRELARCGHYPWLEKAAREEFFAALGEWLTRS
jgi:pimeloyl-ACP methyl ester carboxylesterase